MASEIERARTYANYVRAFVVYCDQHGCGTESAILEAQDALPWFLSTQQDGIASHGLRHHLFRGWLTRDTMQSLPIGQMPDLAIGASMWLPVQAYYTCHGVGLAALHAIGCQMPAAPEQSHAKFLSMASANLISSGLLVPPFSMTCSGDSTANGEAFGATSVTPAAVREASNLAAPTAAADAELLIAKCLKTTRREVLKLRQHRKRRREKRKRLSPAEKQSICAGIPPTTCLDFLYRLRVCCNYDDAEVFLFGQDVSDAASHCKRVIWATRAVSLQLENVVRRKLGAATMQVLEKEYAAHHT